MIPEHQLTRLPHSESAGRRSSGLPVPGGVRRRGRRRGTVPVQLEHHEVGRLLNMLLEAYDGHRPAVQVQPLVDPALFETFRRPRPARFRHRVRKLRTCRPADGVIEAAALIQGAHRLFALAARFQRYRDGWRCTRFHVLDPRTTLRAAA